MVLVDLIGFHLLGSLGNRRMHADNTTCLIWGRGLLQWHIYAESPSSGLELGWTIKGSRACITYLSRSFFVSAHALDFLSKGK